jgi:hypothetical protein
MRRIFVAQNCGHLYRRERVVGDNFKISGSRFKRRASSFEISSRQRGDWVRAAM